MSEDTRSPDRTPGPATTTQSPSLPGLIRSVAHRLAGERPVLPVEGRLPSFDGATGWLNSEPLTPEGLRGRVVLVDFWTYTCVNWLRTLPYVRAWAAKYADAGLTVLGVHTPEFGFERNIDNIVARSRDFGVGYPIAVDSDYGVWRAFDNHFWPALYLADGEGRIRFHHFGEGEYAMTEMVIQQLLLDAGAEGIDQDLVTVEPRGLEVAADWRTLQSPETYLGHERSTGFAQAMWPPWTSPSNTALPRGSPSTPGASGGLDGHPEVGCSSTSPVDGSRSSSTPAMSTWSWGRRPGSLPPVPDLPRWAARGRCAWHGCCLGRFGDGGRPAHIPAGPPAGTDQRPPVRDRVPRGGRRGVLLHLRLSRAVLGRVQRPARVNITCVTPLGEVVASIS